MAGATCFLFLKNIIGPITDYIPVMHPIGYPQAMVMDYKNLLGKGCTALYLTSPRHIYYIYVAKSINEFMQKHIENTEKNQFQKQGDGEITTFYNLDTIYG